MTRVSALLLGTMLAGCATGLKAGSKPDSASHNSDTGYRDTDNDGHPDVADCGPADGTVFPGAPELCNGVDDDCDGVIDEEATDALPLWTDADGDGYGDDSAPVEGACAATSGTASQGGDCDDADEAVHPEANEVCWSGRDDNCDGDPGRCGPSGAPTTAALTARWRGALAGDRLGSSVAWMDDPSGSGKLVLAAGVPGLDGGVGGVAMLTSPLDGGVALATAGTRTAGQAGTAIEPAGDLDGDGLMDLLVSAPGASSGAGEVVVWLGGADGLIPDAGRLEGSSAGDSAGSSLSAGDLDADGHIDAVVGIPTDIFGGLRGVVAVHAGPLNGSYATTAGSLARVHGATPGGQTGADVAADGDVNGDGLADLVVGSPHEGGGEMTIWLGPLSGDLALSDADHRYVGDGVAYEIGRTVAWAGDTDGDGGDDLLVGAPEGSLDGAVVLFYSEDIAGADYLLGGDEVGAAITGTHYSNGGIARIGDVNGDGLPDVFGGGPGVHWSPLEGGIDADEADLQLLPSTTDLGRDNPGWLPASLSPLVSGLPDLDEDGFAEVIFAGPSLAPDGQTRAGEVQVLSSLGW